MKLKQTKTFIEGPRTKIKNQKNKDRSWNINKKECQDVIFKGWERKEKQIHQQQTTTAYTCTATSKKGRRKVHLTCPNIYYYYFLYLMKYQLPLNWSNNN